MIFEDGHEQLERVHYWLQRWAAFQRTDRAEIQGDVGFPAATVIGQHAVTNFSVSEDDRGHYYDLHDAAQVRLVDTAVEDLREAIPWAYWAILRRHKLGNGGFSDYEMRFKQDRMPAGMYTSALDELLPAMIEKGLI